MALVTPVFRYDTVTKILSISYLPGGAAAEIGTYDPVTGRFAVIPLSVQNSGDTNNSASGSGADFDHNLTFSIPANFMIAKRVFRVTAHFRITTGPGPPSLTHKLKLGSTVIGETGSIAAGVSLTNGQTGYQWIFQSTQAPGAAANVECMAVTPLNNLGVVGTLVTAMPVAIATNAAQVLKVATQWSAAGTGTTTISLSQFILEALN